MARKRRARRFNLRPIRVNSSLAIGALASADVIAGAITNNATNRLRVISAHLAYSITDLAAVVDDAFAFGIAHGDYSAAEIEECLEAGGAMDMGDKIALEQSSRLVREVGMINSSGAQNVGAGINFADGRIVKTKLNWVISIGESLQLWVRNNSGVVYSTGSLLATSGKFWVKDI